jgi:hypothetical protein
MRRCTAQPAVAGSSRFSAEPVFSVAESSDICLTTAFLCGQHRATPSDLDRHPDRMRRRRRRSRYPRRDYGRCGSLWRPPCRQCRQPICRTRRRNLRCRACRDESGVKQLIDVSGIGSDPTSSAPYIAARGRVCRSPVQRANRRSRERPRRDPPSPLSDGSIERRRKSDGLRRRGTDGSQTRRWREMDSNHRYPRQIFSAARRSPRKFTFRNINRLPRASRILARADIALQRG